MNDTSLRYTAEAINKVYMAGANSVNVLDSPKKTAVKLSPYKVLTEIDVSIGGYFHSTIQIRDYGDDLVCYLGNTDISNELSDGMMDKIIKDCK